MDYLVALKPTCSFLNHADNHLAGMDVRLLNGDVLLLVQTTQAHTLKSMTCYSLMEALATVQILLTWLMMCQLAGLF
jgi:hypothetical protein